MVSCCWYHKGTNFQANHNCCKLAIVLVMVVADTTKVRIFKQITTGYAYRRGSARLLLIPQRYEFSSKSQHQGVRYRNVLCCCWYHKGTNFQANHNKRIPQVTRFHVVADTTKVRIFKQITTICLSALRTSPLLLIPQRYEFSSKSQRQLTQSISISVVADTTKVRIFKQITTRQCGQACK